MKANLLVFVGVVIVFVLLPRVAAAAVWEELYSSKAGTVEARVEIKKRSFKKRLKRGEKIVTAHLRSMYREGDKKSQATGDYEVHCASRKAFRSNLNMEVNNQERVRSTVRTSEKTQLEGKEYQDFVGLMEILCTRE